MPKIFEKKRKDTLMSQALNRIRKAIKVGKLKPGERLVETRLSEEMGMSRFPIREALRYLEKEGLIETKPFKGTYVTRFNKDDLDEIYSLRSAIEELAVRILAKNINEEMILKLTAIMKNMEKAAAQKDLEKVIQEDFTFHRAICELSGHKKLMGVWKNLENQLSIYLSIEKELGEVDPAKYPGAHYPILEAIKSGNSSFAEQVIRTHLNEARKIQNVLT